VRFSSLLAWLLVLVIFFTTNLTIVQPAEAIIRQQQETPEQMLYQSRHTLRDESGNSWQIILFKRSKNGEVNEIDLRLVGFPGIFEFNHPQGLKIITDKEVFLASDRFAEQSPSPNVAQFDLKAILPQLLTKQSLTLKLPLKKDRVHTLTVPFPVILEWQEIARL
jgi:hypothetical protein